MDLVEAIYFGLLWEHELELIKPLLAAIAAQRDAVLERWFELYGLHFGDRGALSRAEFLAIHGPDLDATVATLGRAAFDEFAAAMRGVGERLAERRAPFAEIIASMHLFEEAAIAVFPDSADAASYRLFDKISHCRTAALAESYFKSHSAALAARLGGLEREAARIPPEARSRFQGIVGAAPTMRALYERIEAVAAVRSAVLIVGESGTGKELIARAIHERSPGRNRPFVALNCAALPRELFESELFGYRRGAFSGAVADYLGLYRAAQGGTLFLDEITEMASETQGKLLRALQEQLVRPIGSTHEVAVDARVIASTNRDPEEAVGDRILRGDLYYRLCVNLLQAPPLRERIDDLPLLIDHFVALYNEKLRREDPIVGVDGAALAAMRRHRWPGNIRELSNVIEQAFTFCRANLITVEQLPISLTPSLAAIPAASRQPLNEVLRIADYQRGLVERALARTGGNKLKAAQLLGISRKALYAKLRKYGLAGAINGAIK